MDSIDSNNNNIYDVYYDVYLFEDTDTGSPGVANPEVSFAVALCQWHRVNRGPPGRGMVLSLGSESHSSSLFNAYDIYS